MNALLPLLVTGFFTVAPATASWAQHQPGVYATSQEYVKNQPAHPGTVGAPPASMAYLEVVNTHTHAVHRVPMARVWGYANAKGQAFRIVEHKAYAIQPQQDGMVTYSRKRAIQHSRTKHVVTEHFYSENLDGKLHALTKRGLKKRQAAAI